MNHKQAFQFALSIQSLAGDLLDELNRLDWEKFADTLSLIQDDTERLTEYSNERLIEKEENK